MTMHDNIPVWEVDLTVLAPVSINNTINFHARKELEHPDLFYSNVKIENSENGFDVTLTAFALNPELAEKAAILFLGKMLDVLSLQINLPLQSDITKNVLIPRNEDTVRRILNKADFRRAFQEARLLSLTERTFLRALSWFRKGKFTQDPFDKFLAFWNAIETVTGKYNPNEENCKGKGSICRVWECFKTVWGECEDWEFIGGQTKWIDQCNEHRVSIAHGTVPIEVDSVEKVIDKIDELEKVTHKFLTDWRDSQLKPLVTDEIGKKLV